MIETNYIITCDRCDNRGPYDQPSKIHSLNAFGPILIGSLWKRLYKIGWRRIGAKDTCPDCIRRLWGKPARKAKKKCQKQQPKKKR